MRGYLAGSGWKEYRAAGTVCGVAAAAPGCASRSSCPEPIFTPSTKAPVGRHDEPITFDAVVDLVGGERAEEPRALALAVYRRAAAHALGQGIIVADTKFELGVLDGSAGAGRRGPHPGLVAVLAGRRLGARPHATSFDKQPVRD